MLIFIGLLLLSTQSRCSDITSIVFGSEINASPAAFGDFNSDEVIDLFVVGEKHMEILLGASEGEPLLRRSNLSCNFSCPITSVVPGDFNGDAFLDALVTLKCDESQNVLVLWGRLTSLNCSNQPLFQMRDQPLALDYNQDFITDLFGEDEKGSRMFWVFHKNGSFTKIPLEQSLNGVINNPIRKPHSNAYLHLDNALMPDLFITSGKSDSNLEFEIWNRSTAEEKFVQQKILRPPKVHIDKMGQSLFLDVELKGKLNLVVPVWTGKESKLYVLVKSEENSTTTSTWHDFGLNLTDPKGVTWRWAWDADEPSLQAITIRGGDFNMDGFPDLLAPLMNPSGSFQTVLLENTPCPTCSGITRDYHVNWDAFYPHGNDSVAGAFFDIFQDGVMDVILVYKRGDKFSMGAFKNNLDYDANFIKVMVVSGVRSEEVPFVVTPLGKHKRTFGSNIGGVRVSYRTLDQAGLLRLGVSAQLPQTAYFALGLPYTSFALGRTPNFVDAICVAYGGYDREWPQLIPNSQMVVIPNPIENPVKWKAQLFVTPSKVILLSAAALIVICIVISLTIAFLHWNERRTDRLERLLGDDKFYFDAM